MENKELTEDKKKHMKTPERKNWTKTKNDTPHT